MILRLFLVFLEIGAVSFGGGYGMLPVIRDTCISAGFLTEEQFVNFIAVAESTPGPIAINMATFIGSAQAGFLGALVAMLGVVLPAFLIILLIAAILKNLMQYKGVQGFLSGVRPAVAALILATAITMGIRTFFGVRTVSDAFTWDYKPFVILAVLVLTGLGGKYLLKRRVSPIVTILISAGLGMLLYGVF